MNLEEYRDKENDIYCLGFINDLLYYINLYVYIVIIVFNICIDRRKLLLLNF